MSVSKVGSFMSIPSIPPVGSLPTGVGDVAGIRPDAGFGAILRQGLEGVSDLERAADRAATGFAAGDGTKVHEVMVASSKSSLAVDLLTQVRNRAIEAYTEIMRLQV